MRAIVLEPKFIDLDEPAPVLVMPAQIVDLTRDLQKRRSREAMISKRELSQDQEPARQ